jgi:hypothetical protein
MGAIPVQVKTQPTVVVITITEGQPDPNPARVRLGNMLRFDNTDDRDYLIWGLRISRYLGTDVLLPALGSVTVFVDAATEQGTFGFELFPTNLRNRAILASRAGIVPLDAGGGGGQIIVDP